MGRGSGIRAASRSSIGIDFYYQGIRCRERLKLSPTPANLKYAKRLKSTIEMAIEKGTFDYADYFPNSRFATKLTKIPGAVISVKDALRAWLIRIEKTVERSTYLDYRNSVENHLIPEFGDTAIARLKKREVQNWTAGLSVSAKRIKNLLIPLRETLQDALDNEDITKNPILDLKIKRRSSPTKETIDPFGPREIEAILKALPDQGKNLFEFAFWTGLRTSELIAVEWGDVDWHKGEIQVRRARVRKELKGPKTSSGNRPVKLLQPALEALERQKAHTYLAGQEIFHNPRTAAPWVGDGAIRKTCWQPALRKAKVRYRYPYQTRHTYASMMLSAGENPLWVARQMGHKDWSMIVKTYGKWIPESDPLAGEKAVSVFSEQQRAAS